MHPAALAQQWPGLRWCSLVQRRWERAAKGKATKVRVKEPWFGLEDLELPRLIPSCVLSEGKCILLPFAPLRKSQREGKGEERRRSLGSRSNLRTVPLIAPDATPWPSN